MYLENAVKHFLTPKDEYNQQMTTLFKKDIQWRLAHKLNNIVSFQGEQGSGKSSSALALALYYAKIYGVPFTIDNVAFTHEQLLAKWKNAPPRSTLLLDEQAVKEVRVGSMSRTRQMELQDREEQLRYTQINVIYASPTARSHAHYSKFVEYGALFDEQGYPDHFNFIWYTPNQFKTDMFGRQEFYPRAIISFPMYNKELAGEYDKIKGEYVEMARKSEKEGGLVDLVEKQVDDILKKHPLREFIQKNAKGGYKVVSQERLSFKVYKVCGTGKYTKDVYKMIFGLIREKAYEFTLTMGEIEDEP